MGIFDMFRKEPDVTVEVSMLGKKSSAVPDETLEEIANIEAKHTVEILKVADKYKIDRNKLMKMAISAAMTAVIVGDFGEMEFEE